MRRVRFAAADRLLTVPVELMQILRYLPYLLAAIILLHLPRLRVATMLGDVFPLAAAIFSGTVLMPLLLPWLPGRAFSAKGLMTGLALWLLCWLLLPWSLAEALAWMLIVGAVSAFLALNYTGASVITSLSGVKKEMRLAMPAIITAAAVGIILRVILRFTLGG
jgi:acetyl-CoA decarbonylase/synthase complex subunit gamma